MFFDNWQEHKYNTDILKPLLWEYDFDKIDWKKMSVIVVQRVIERGRMPQYYAVIKLYKGIKNIQEIIKKIPTLTKRDIAFVCIFFNLQKEELLCYKKTHWKDKI